MSEFDTSKLEKTGWRFFRDQMYEWYSHEFPELSEEYKNNAIDYVIENNAKIFSKNFVLNKNFCHRCGLCCREIGCPDFDKETNLCTKHNNQNSEMCREYPWSSVGMVFTYNCGYQRDIFHLYMDMFFTKAIEKMKRDKNEVHKEDG